LIHFQAGNDKSKGKNLDEHANLPGKSYSRSL